VHDLTSKQQTNIPQALMSLRLLTPMAASPAKADKVTHFVLTAMHKFLRIPEIFASASSP
jgi:hypothetical protein